ncbi:MAG: hypothetical protein VYA34_09635 [Myxococcota bacterium]|nr:hypothetical protein [Myxococcota bacterium]
MANFKTDTTLKFITTKDGDVEEAEFSAGDEIEILETWENHYLIKDDDGHYFNVDKGLLDE